MLVRLVLGAFFVACLAGCADAPEPAAGESGVSLLWAALEEGGACQNTAFGQGVFPPGSDRLVVRMEGGDVGDNPVVGTFAASTTELVGQGALLVIPPPSLVPPGASFDLRVLACRPGDDRPAWSGGVKGLTVARHAKSGVLVLLTPEDDQAGAAPLACPTQDVVVGDRRVGTANPSEPTAFSGLAVVQDGHSLLIGGAAVRDGRLVASSRIDLMHGPTGTFLPQGGALSTPRALAETRMLADGRVLVFGGTTGLAVGTPPSNPFFHPGDAAIPLAAGAFLERVDPSTGTSTAVPVSSAGGSGPITMPLMSATHYDEPRDTLFVVGGYDTTGAGTAPGLSAVRISAVSTDGPVAAARALGAPRVGAVLLPAVDGSVVIFGGNTDGTQDNIGEWISADGLDGGPAEVEVTADGSGGTTLPVPTFASALQVGELDTARTFLVLGGIPAQECTAPCDPTREGLYPSTIDEDIALLVRVTTTAAGAPQVDVVKASLSDAPGLGRRAFATLQHFGVDGDGRPLYVVAGGITGLSAVPGFSGCSASAADQCLRDDLTVFRLEGLRVVVERTRKVGAAVGLRMARRVDGTYLLSSALVSSLPGSVALGGGPRLWNPLEAAELALCSAQAGSGL